MDSLPWRSIDEDGSPPILPSGSAVLRLPPSALSAQGRSEAAGLWRVLHTEILTLIRALQPWALSILIHAAVLLSLSFFLVLEAREERSSEVRLEVTAQGSDSLPVFEPLDIRKPEEKLQETSEKERKPTPIPHERREREAYRKEIELPEVPPPLPQRVSTERKLEEILGAGSPFDLEAREHYSVRVRGAPGGRSDGFSHRTRGKRELVARGGGGADTESAVLAGLRWLARHQNPDGSWNDHTKQCREEGRVCGNLWDYDVAMTGLALMAFLGAGTTPSSEEVHDGVRFGSVVQRGLKWLLSRQQENGAFSVNMYHHAIGTIAMCEALGLTRDTELGPAGAKAVDYVLDAQSRKGEYPYGWRYTYRSPSCDTSVTGWAVMALKAGEEAGIEAARKGYEGAVRWLDHVTEPTYYWVGYADPTQGNLRLTAVGLLCRIFMGERRDTPKVRGAAALVTREPPPWREYFGADSADLYLFYYGTLGVFQFDGPEGPRWKEWNEDMKEILLAAQNRNEDACAEGSWEVVDLWCGSRVYSTALCTMMLEVYYRYPAVFGGKK